MRSSTVLNEKESPSFFSDRFFVASRQDRAALLENLSLLVSSGMGLSLAFETMFTDARSRGMQRILGRLRDDVESGFPLWQALDRTKLFGESTVALLKIGEETGRLSENFRLVNEREEKERALRSRLRSATLYPLFVFILTAGIGVGIAWFILPELSRVFSELRITLPLPTKVLIVFGGFFEQYGAVAIPSFFCCPYRAYLFSVLFPKDAFYRSVNSLFASWDSTIGTRGGIGPVRLSTRNPS